MTDEDFADLATQYRDAVLATQEARHHVMAAMAAENLARTALFDAAHEMAVTAPSEGTP